MINAILKIKSSIKDLLNFQITNLVHLYEHYRLKKIGDSGYNCLKHIERSSLSPKEKENIKEKWSKIIPNPEIGYDQFEIYKSLRQFDVEFIPNAYFHRFIGEYLFNHHYGKIYSDKNMMWNFLHGLPQIPTVVRNISSDYFDSDGNPLDKNEAIKIISDFGEDMIIKPAKESCGGNNVELIKKGCKKNEVDEYLNKFSKDFIIQSKATQSESTKILNPSSLNTIRVNSLFLNNRFSVTSMGIRIGEENSLVDNASSNGIMAGIDENGFLKPIAFDLHGNKYETVRGIKLCEIRIANINKVKELAIEAHKRMPQSKMIAWDIFLDHNDNPHILEANVGYMEFYPGTWP